MNSYVRTAFAAAVRLDHELTTYELGASTPEARFHEVQRAAGARQEAGQRLAQLQWLLRTNSDAAAASKAFPVGHMAATEPDTRGACARCQRLSVECEQLHQHAARATQASAGHKERALVEVARARASIEAEREGLQRAASEATAALTGSQTALAAAEATARSKAQRIAELEAVVRKLQPAAAAAASMSVQLRESQSRATAFEELARRGAEDAMALGEARRSIRGLKRRAADQQDALEQAQAEVERLRPQAIGAAAARVELELASGKAAELEAMLARATADGVELTVARAKLAVLEARLAALNEGESSVAAKAPAPAAGAAATVDVPEAAAATEAALDASPPASESGDPAEAAAPAPVVAPEPAAAAEAALAASSPASESGDPAEAAAPEPAADAAPKLVETSLSATADGVALQLAAKSLAGVESSQ